MLEVAERKAGYSQLNGLEKNYNNVKVEFDPAGEKKFFSLCKILP